MSEKMSFRPEAGAKTEEQKQLLEGVVFSELEKKSGEKEYRSSAPGRKIVLLREGSTAPEPGRSYQVRVIEDTEPKDPTRGKLLVEIVLNPEEQEKYMQDLAKGAERALENNDLGVALEKMRALRQAVLSEREVSFEAGSELKEVREVFKENFLGIEEAEKFTGYKLTEKEQKLAIQKWQEKARDQKLTKESLEQMEKEGFMVVFRSPKLTLEGKKKGEKVEALATVENLRKKYGKLFYNQDWYNEEKFATKEAVELGWSIVKKEVLEESRNKDWDEQEEVLKDWAKKHKVDSKLVKRRTPQEATYDVLAYYDARKERILEKDYDWTSVQSSGGDFVYVGSFQPDGLNVPYHARGTRSSTLGVCPSR